MVLKYYNVKILLTVFLFTVGISLIPLPSQAGNLQYNTEVGIPGARDTVTFTGDTSAIGNYIKAIYSYGIGIVGILAAVVLMVGGVIWLTAGGNVNKVGTAKQTIGGALTGLILALTSYMLLYQINPDLVQFRVRNIAPIDNTELASYERNIEKISSNCGWTGVNCQIYSSQSAGEWVETNQEKCQGEKPRGNYYCCCKKKTTSEAAEAASSDTVGCCLWNGDWRCEADITKGDCEEKSGSVNFYPDENEEGEKMECVSGGLAGKKMCAFPN